MSKTPVIYSYNDIELDQISFRKMYKIGNNLVKGIMTYNDQVIYIRGPKMTLGSDIAQNGNYYYIDLNFDVKLSNNQKFYRFITNIDHLVIAEILENPTPWFGQSSSDISLIQIEQEYIPTIKLSTVFTSRKSMKLKVNIDKIEFYDQDGVMTVSNLIKENYKVTPLLRLTSTYKDNNRIWTNWELLQLKVDLPDPVLSGCHLSDVTGDTDDEAIPDIDENTIEYEV